MVKVGFICEGDVEKLIIESDKFQSLLKTFDIECVQPVINATGRDNLLPARIAEHRETLKRHNAEVIIIITDLDDNKCITLTKERIQALENEIVIVSVKQIEAWFLADSDTLSNIFNTNYSFEYPENELKPFDTIRSESMRVRQRGFSKNSKTKLANSVLRSGFSIENAANHENCASAKYFIKKLKEISNNI